MADFLSLTNRILRRLNEVELTSADFASARGIQAAAKDAINSAVFDLNRQQFTWPFNAAQENTTLVVGQVEYSNPLNMKTIEWNSFQITKDAGTGVEETYSLKYLDRDVYYANFRNEDDDNTSAGLDKPIYVYRSHGTGFGVSPAPDKTYRLSFRYFLHPTELVDVADTPTGNVVYPNVLDYIITEGAMSHLYLFKDNPEAAQLAMLNFQNGIADLKAQYINQYDNIRDTRVNFGGNTSRSAFSKVTTYG